MTFSALKYIELLRELEKFTSTVKSFGDYRLDNSLLIRHKKENSAIFFESRSGLKRDVFSIINPNHLINTNITDGNFIYFPKSNSIVLNFNEKCEEEIIQYCDLQTVDCVEFQMGTVNQYSSIYAFLCYMFSINYTNGIYGSYNNDPATLNYILKLLKDKNEAITT